MKMQNLLCRFLSCQANFFHVVGSSKGIVKQNEKKKTTQLKRNQIKTHVSTI